MKSLILWTGVLAGSVALGLGMYGVVVAPATEGLEVSGSTAAPHPRETVIKVKTRVVQDPPRVRTVPSPADAGAAPVPEGRWGGTSASDDSGSGASPEWGGSDDSGSDDTDWADSGSEEATEVEDAGSEWEPAEARSESSESEESSDDNITTVDDSSGSGSSSSREDERDDD